jgi:amidase
MEPSIDTIGILARSISDIQLVAGVLRVVANPLPDLSHATLKNCRFGFVKTELFDALGSSSLKGAWQQAKDVLTQAGATIEDIDLGEEFNGWEGKGGKFDRIFNAAASVACFREYILDPDHISSSIAHQVKQGIPTRDVAKILDDLAVLRPKFDQIARHYDAIIAPSSLDVAPDKHDADTIEIGGIWSGLHVPAISIPGLAGMNGLPIGLTMVASRYVFRGSSADAVLDTMIKSCSTRPSLLRTC